MTVSSIDTEARAELQRGIENVAVACGGRKDSFLGVPHAQGRDGVEFYTDKKFVIERWPREWSRRVP